MFNTNETSDNSTVVLIIDDSYENRVVLSSQLMLEGYQTRQASGGREGIADAQQHDPDIILLDVMMPDMNGFEVCRQLKSDLSTHLIPIIMVSALREVDSRIEGKKAGADDFLSRPYVREELLVRVRTLVQLKRARVALEEERNRLRLLYDISRAISQELDLVTMMSNIITETQKALGAFKGNIMLLDDEQKVMQKFLVREGEPLKITDYAASDVISRGLGGWLITHNRGDIIHNTQHDPRWITLPDDDEETGGAAIGVPLSAGSKIVGFLILNHPEPGYFQQEHLALLQAIASAITTAIQNASLFGEINEERQKLGAILSQATDAIITTDEKRRITLFNQTAEGLFMLQAANVVGKKMAQVPELRALMSIFDKAIYQPFASEIEMSDSSRILYATVSPIHFVGYAAVLQDISEMKRIEGLRLEKERMEKQRVKETFSRYMGPSLVEHVLENVPNLMARRERRQVVVMFADIRDFTRFTRHIEPDEVVDRLNTFFNNMTEVIYSFDGTIFELTGDEILVGFNAPFAQEDAPTRAVATAVALHRRFNSLRETLFGGLNIEFGMGVGIDQGEVVVGNVGAETRMTFRMVGDAVNMAHRLVDLARDRQVIISETVYQTVNLDSHHLQGVVFESTDPILIKGKDEPSRLYSTTVNGR